LIERCLPYSFRYHVTAFGFCAALLLTWFYNHLLRAAPAAAIPALRAVDAPLKRAFETPGLDVSSSGGELSLVDPFADLCIDFVERANFCPD
jgi:hypothetical protein